MVDNDLERFLAHNPLSFPGVQRLLAAGADRVLLPHLTGAGLIGAARVHVSADGASFEPDGPDARLLLAVCDAAGTVIDVAALSTSDENEWALLTGAGDMLGDELIVDCVVGLRRELRLFSTPMDWLRGGGNGICVVQWSKTALSMLRGMPETAVLVVDAGARERLRGMLAFGGLPQIAEIRGRFVAPSSAGRGASAPLGYAPRDAADDRPCGPDRPEMGRAA